MAGSRKKAAECKDLLISGMLLAALQAGGLGAAQLETISSVCHLFARLTLPAPRVQASAGMHRTVCMLWVRALQQATLAQQQALLRSSWCDASRCCVQDVERDVLKAAEAVCLLERDLPLAQMVHTCRLLAA